MATTTPSQAITFPFKQRALRERVAQAAIALDDLARMGIVERPKPLSYWQSEFRALAAALDAGTGIAACFGLNAPGTPRPQQDPDIDTDTGITTGSELI